MITSVTIITMCFIIFTTIITILVTRTIPITIVIIIIIIIIIMFITTERTLRLLLDAGFQGF